jgi:hypothetical protein
MFGRVAETAMNLIAGGCCFPAVPPLAARLFSIASPWTFFSVFILKITDSMQAPLSLFPSK